MRPSLTIPLLRKKACAGNFTALGTAVLPLFDVGPDVRALAPLTPLTPLTPLSARTPWLRMSAAGQNHDNNDEAEVLPSPRKVK